MNNECVQKLKDSEESLINPDLSGGLHVFWGNSYCVDELIRLGFIIEKVNNVTINKFGFYEQFEKVKDITFFFYFLKFIFLYFFFSCISFYISYYKFLFFYIFSY